MNNIDFSSTLSCAFDSISDPICITIPSENSRILYANAATATLVGVKKPDDLNGKSYEEISSPLCEDEKIVTIWRDQDKEISANPLKKMKVLEIHPDAVSYPYIVNKTALYNEEKNFMGVLLHMKYLEMYRPNDFIKGRLPGSLLLNKPDELFTERECEIIFLRLQGMTCKTIGDMLCRSERTIENGMYNLYQKANVGNYTEFEEFCEKRNLHRYLPKRFINPERHSFSGSFEVEDEGAM